MATTFQDIELEVRTNINDANADVSGIIDQAINLIGNFLSQNKIDTSVETSIGDDFIDLPDNCIAVEQLKIGDDFYKKTDFSGAEEAGDYELNRFYEYGGKIQLSVVQDAVTTCKIWCRTGFTPLAGVAEAVTDLPERYLPALYMLATWLYWLQLVSKVATGKEQAPAMSVEEAEKVADNWGKQFREMLAIIKKGR